MPRLGRAYPIQPLYGLPSIWGVLVLSLPTEVSITDTTATVGCTTTSLIGTLYYFISTSATPPSAADLKAGTGSVDFGNDATITNPQTFGATGLSASTTYYTYFIQNDGSDDSNLLESGSWATTAGTSIPIFMHHYKQLMGAN